jgi:alpha-beta hydrolase superfamily lysophospholipase
LASGDRNGHYKIQEHHHQIAAMLQHVRTDLPCFLQAHSMGSLSSVAFLINNPHIKIEAVIAGSPFWGFGAKMNNV